MSDFYIPSDDDAASGETTLLGEADAFELPGAPAQAADTSDLAIEGGDEALLTDLYVPPKPQQDPTTPTTLPPPPVTRSAPSGETRRERIAASTRAGGFGATLPVRFDDPDASPPGDDWRVALSDDPFERLYLDWTQSSRVAAETVRQHGAAIARFWAKRAAQLEAGADARDRIQKRYGNRTELRLREQQARDDAAALATPSLRGAVVEARLDALRVRTSKRLDKFLLGDQVLSPPESESLLDEAVQDGWTRAAAAAYVLAEADRRHLRPLEEPDAAEPPSDRLLSTSWTALDLETDAETVLGAPLATAMLAGSLAPAELAAFLDLAEARGLDREDTAAFIAERLGVFRDEWCPAPGQVSIDGTLAQALASVRWVSPERYPDLLAVARNAHANATAAALTETTLTPSAASSLLDRADLKRDDAAAFVLDVLRSRGFEPTQTPSGEGDAAQLVSTTWVAPKQVSPAFPALPVDPTPSDPPRPRRLGRTVLAGTLVGLAVLAALFVWWRIPPPPPMATVDTDRANVRTEPSVDGEDATILGTSTRGEQLIVLGYAINGEGKTWLRVDHRNGPGWVSDKIVQFTRYGEVPQMDMAGQVLGADEGPDASNEPTMSSSSGSEPGLAASAEPDQTWQPAQGTEPSSPTQSSGSPARPATTPARSTPAPTRSVPQAARAVTPPPVPTPAPTRPANRLYAVSEVDRPASPATSPRAESPAGGYSGALKVAVEVDDGGRVTRVTCATNAPQAACAEAERRARSVRFQPAQLRGYPVRTQSEVTVVFTAAAQPAAEAAGQSCTRSAIRALMTEVNQTDARCRRLQDPAEKQDCEARLARANADLNACTQ